MKLTTHDIRVRHNNLKLEKSQFEMDLRNYVVDKEIPLEDRWETFEQCDIGDYAAHNKFPHLDETDLMNLYLTRYETYSVFEILDRAKEEGYLVGEKQINEFKEFCLDEFTIELKFDW